MLILGGLVAGGLGYIFAKTDKAMELDERARKKYTQAFETQAAALELVKEKQQTADNALTKVINRKRAILSTTMKDFIDLYERIIKIDFTSGLGIDEVKKFAPAPINIENIKYMSVTAISPMSEKELVNTFLIEGFKGVILGGVVGGVAGMIGNTMVKEAEREVSKANSQLKISKVAYSQAETISIALDAIIIRSNKISELLANMNLLFTRSIKTSFSIIDKNGDNRKAYTVEDRSIIMNSINLADAIKKILDTPLLDKTGEITEASLIAFETGNSYLEKFKQM